MPKSHCPNGKITRHIKIDAKKPSKLEVTGWSASGEISAAPHTLTVLATDEAPSSETHGSGVKSLTVSVDGGAATSVPGAACSLGKCTASGTYTLNAESLSEGVHRLIETATDNAGNVASKEFTFDVRHGTPISVAPGLVDPTTGQFKLSATDVSLAGVGAVARTYQSRNLTAGAEGPLGPQWALSAGGGEGITVLPTGSVVLAGPDGGRTTFVRKANGEFESPLGDSSVKVESKEGVPGKGITEYVVSNATAGTATTFTQPAGTESTAPTFSNQFGSESTQLNHPISAAVDSSGSVWVVDSANSRIEKFSGAGVLLGAYGSYGSAGGQFIAPWGIAINQSTGNVYVTDQGNNRVVQLSASGAFVKAIGWGVADGKAELEVCTSACRPGLAGAGNGQVSVEAGAVVDSTGNIWVADYGNNRVQEFSKEGAYLQKFGTAGTGNGQFKGPLNLAFSGGMLYVADYENNRVEEFSTAGKYEAKFGEGTLSKPYGLASDPKSGSLYVGDFGNTRVDEFSSTGTLITKFGSSGSGAGQFTGPTGIAVNAAGAAYIVDNGSNRVEEWTHPSWLPTISDGPLPSDTTSYAYEAVEVEAKTVIRPTEALAPPPAGVTCGTKPSELKKGCRALTFEYATSTTATGEGPSGWKDYSGRLKKILFHAYSPTTKAMTEPAVVEYAYDTQGRLRAEWDPRITPPLKTTYGYDSEGHVTAMTPPGAESWAFIYGTIAGDPNEGRLVKVTRAPASAPLWNGALPTNTEAPKLTGTPVAGVSMGVSHGAWSNSPVVYGYQWERCNSSGGECVATPGATNPNYTPSSADAGHKIAAVVTATNGGGSVAASVVTSAIISASAAEYSLPSGSHPLGVANGPDGYVWFTEVFKAKIGKIAPGGTPIEYKLSSETLDPTGITAGPDGNLWFTDWTEGSTSHVGKITPSGTVSEYTLPTNSHPEGITTGPDGKLWFTDYSTNKIGRISTSGTELAEWSLPAGSHPLYITAGPDGKLWFTEPGTNKLGKFSTSGQELKEYALPAGSSPIGITSAGGKVWFTERGTNKIGKISTSGTELAEYSLPSGSRPTGITLGPDGNLWYTDIESSKIGKITTSGTPTEYAIPTKSEPSGIATGPDNNLWYADQWTTKIAEIPTAGTTPSEGEHHSPEPGTTIEYHLPLTGTGLPTVTKAAVEKWGQYSDQPTEGTAVIPPDEPQGWPASSYKRATIDYLDELGRTVNIANPTGGITTSEYNEANEVVRTLSADNRAAALKEGAKSAEVSEKLDTKTQYNPFDTQIVKVTGPQHTVKLSSGAEVQARSVTRNSYDEGAPGGHTYNLVTKTTVGAEYEGKEVAVRTTLKGYSGQENLGWTLREPTSTTIDPSGLDLASKTFYDPTTGNVTETRSPGANSETIYPPSWASSFEGEGAGAGQLSFPLGGAFDSAGNLWVPDSGNNRIVEFSSSGAFIKTVGWGVKDGKSELQVCTANCKGGLAGTGNGQFKGPGALAINPLNGNVDVADTESNRVQALTSAGGFVALIGTSGAGALSEPRGVVFDSAGDLWVSDSGHNRVVEFGTANQYLREVATAEGALNTPRGITISEGTIFVVDAGNSRVVQLSSTGGYIGQFGSNGSGTGQFKEPYGIASNPSTGIIYVADLGNNRVQEFSPAGRYLTNWETGGPKHPLTNPVGLAVASNGKLYISDLFGAKLSTWTPPEAGAADLHYNSKIGSSGSGAEQFSSPEDIAFDGAGNKWVSDYGNNRIEEFSPSGGFLKVVGWGVSDGKSELQVCTSGCRAGLSGAGKGQFNGPGGIDVNQTTGNVYVADVNNARVQELSSSGGFITWFGTSGSGKLSRPGSLAIDSGGNVWVPDMTLSKIFEYSSSGSFINAYGKEGSGSEVAFKKPVALTISGETVAVADTGNHRVVEISTTGTFVREFAKEGSGSGELYSPEGIAADAAGHLYVVDNAVAHVEEFSLAGAYMATFATEGSGSGEEQLKGPVGDAIDATGALSVADTENNRVQKWSYVDQRVHYSKTIYYTAAANSEYPQCGEHAEWANLPCLTKPVDQPSDAPPNLPETTMTYNIWDELEVKTEKFGSTTRTTTQTYDAAGRAMTSEESSTAGTALPMVTNEYSEASGALVKQSTTTGGTTKTITSVFNTLGQLVSYTDTDGNTSKFLYDIDGRVEEMNDGKGSQIYVHDPATGLLTELFDSAAGKFKATYDPEGKLLTQSYPNGMTASYSYTPIGQATQVEYVKTTHCSSNCTWFSDAIVPAIGGETRSQISTLATESYNYDAIGRLTKVQETPAGQGCTTRAYAYDEESNRTGLTNSGPGGEGKCTEEGATTERHIYDEANRLVDPGTTYDALGNVTSLPAADAGGHEMTDTYYVDNQVHSQTQNEETITYSYDPAGRTREAVSTGKTSSTVVSHYSGPGQALAWTSEGSEAWSRNIPGIDGALDAIQPNGGTPVLQIHDLQGNIVGTAALSETETKLLSTYNSTEFGAPQPGTTPPKYAWLGATGLSTEQALSSGTSAQGGAAYVPQIARDLQTESVVPPGAFPNGQGTGSQYGSEIPGWYIRLSEEQSAATLAEWTATQEALRKQAEEEANSQTGMGGGGEEEGGGETIEITVPENLVIVGSGSAYPASAGVIVCTAKVNYPHPSTHGPGTVNVVATLTCSDSDVALYIRVALFYEHRKVNEGEEDSLYQKEVRANAATRCKTGYYQGWAEFWGQGLDSNPYRTMKWGASRYIRC